MTGFNDVIYRYRMVATDGREVVFDATPDQMLVLAHFVDEDKVAEVDRVGVIDGPPPTVGGIDWGLIDHRHQMSRLFDTRSGRVREACRDVRAELAALSYSFESFAQRRAAVERARAAVDQVELLTDGGG